MNLDVAGQPDRRWDPYAAALFVGLNFFGCVLSRALAGIIGPAGNLLFVATLLPCALWVVRRLDAGRRARSMRLLLPAAPQVGGALDGVLRTPMTGSRKVEATLRCKMYRVDETKANTRLRYRWTTAWQTKTNVEPSAFSRDGDDWSVPIRIPVPSHDASGKTLPPSGGDASEEGQFLWQVEIRGETLPCTARFDVPFE